LRFCIFSKLPGNAQAADPETTLTVRPWTAFLTQENWAQPREAELK
jgi:hypothetical protein